LLSTDKSTISQNIDEKIGIETLFKQLGLKEVNKIGDRITSICPFHEGADNPNAFSFKVSQGTGYCFTKCHKSYDIYNIIMAAKSCDFTEAIEFISDLIGKEIGFKSKSAAVNADNLNFLKQVKQIRNKKKNEEIAVFDNRILNTFIPKLHTVLRQERFDNETREYFSLSFTFDGYFADRITIPIDNPDGSILTVSGRSIKSDEDIEFENLQKYLLYPGIDKTKTLYNISRADPFIDLFNEVILFEGFKSIWRLHQWGIDNTVATMGSSISDNQIYILLKTGAKIIVCGDNDEAGRKLNKMVIEKTKKFADISYIDMSIINIPEKSSPSDITKEQWEYLYNSRKAVM